jgi:anti-sigma factor RsiW
MSQHLSTQELNAVVDGELGSTELARAGEHLAACLACSSRSLSLGVLKRRVAEAGAAYAVPSDFEQRMRRVAAGAGSRQRSRSPWMAFAAAILICAALISIQQVLRRRAEQTAFAGELLDRHIATLAANTPPQVLSSDRHTVKPWFQGKLPFSFNLPAALPAGTNLDGANLTYIGGRPVAQLLFSIGKHRASVFVEQGGGSTRPSLIQRAGFHIAEFRTAELEGIAVSDADPAALQTLVTLFHDAQ